MSPRSPNINAIDPATINGAMMTGTPNIDGPSYLEKAHAILSATNHDLAQ
jgi:hypothetical protein